LSKIPVGSAFVFAPPADGASTGSDLALAHATSASETVTLAAARSAFLLVSRFIWLET
jgi:hypothetical protein